MSAIAPSPALQSHVPRGIAQRLKNDLAGTCSPFAERYLGIVLLVDIVGFTAITDVIATLDKAVFLAAELHDDRPYRMHGPRLREDAARPDRGAMANGAY